LLLKKKKKENSFLPFTLYAIHSNTHHYDMTMGKIVQEANY